MDIAILGFRFYKGLNIKSLCENASSIFSLNVSFTNGVLDVGLAYDSIRGQYNSTLLLNLLKQSKIKSYASKIIGLTDLDLFVPILTYVFGEAELNGQAAVVSSHRLHNEFYGLPKDDSLLQNRILKEIMHELGHTLGLIHCSDNKCVMHSSTYVEDIDLKDNSLCESCKKLI
ncbi:MAG: archaemetzincin family Zn-dependent metalloprotease [Bacteroidetes bacterium]|nr:archaemetzincin family Zn-dependent metalloprotease [Bacteroidota bacterium]MDI6779767.1 archaemetzincin family Zn-dependent metalloprotease [Bacteroidota bacterium]